jgi:single-strand DNA-binding protein
MNSVNLVGRLTRDPKLVEPSGRPICEMRIGVDNFGHPSTFIEVRSFDEEAYACAEYLIKGQRVAVSGRLLHRQWKSPTGELCEEYRVIGRVDFLDPPNAERRRRLEAEPPYTPDQSREELLAA